MAKHTMATPKTTEEAGFMILGLSMALRFALQDLAHFHEGKPGKWLDELEEKATQEAKGAVYSGAHTIEADGKKLSLQILEIMFKTFRNDLSAENLDP